MDIQCRICTLIVFVLLCNFSAESEVSVNESTSDIISIIRSSSTEGSTISSSFTIDSTSSTYNNSSFLYGDANIRPGKRFENAWKLFFKNGLKTILPSLMNFSSNTGTSKRCIRVLTKYIGALTSAKYWAAKMIDATSKPMAGIFEGTFSDFGAFDQCLDITVPLRNGSEDFRGSYCAIEASPKMPPIPKGFSMAIRRHAGPHDTIEKEISLAGTAFFYLKFRLGVCVPSTCSVEDIRSITSSVAKRMEMNIAIPVCYQRQDSIRFDAIHIVIICIVIMLILAAVAGSRIELLKREKHTTFEKVLLAFSLRSNFQKLFAESKGSGELKALHGIRGLSIAWVIMGHTYVWANFQLLRRPENLQKWFSEIDFEALLNAWLSVEPFFLLSGLLTCYGCMQLMEKTKGRIHIPFFILRRYIRLLPPLLMIMGVVFFLPIISSGPFWYERVDSELESCRTNWWTNLLFISNWTSMKSICIHPSWYIAADFQLHIISLLVLYPLYRSSRLGGIAMFLLVLAATLAVAIITYLFELPPIIQIASGNNEKITETVDKIHMRTFTHIGPYVVGMATGYLILKFKDIKLSKMACIAGWCISFTLSILSVYGVHTWNKGEPHGPVLTCIYAAMHRTTFAIGVAWVAFACITGHAGPVNTILSLPALAPLSRLTFTIYLTQSLVIWTRRASERERMYYSHYNHLYEFMGNLILSILTAVPLHLLVEAPVSNLDRLLFSRPPPSQQEPELPKEIHASNDSGISTSNGFSNLPEKMKDSLDNGVELRSVKYVKDTETT